MANYQTPHAEATAAKMSSPPDHADPMARLMADTAHARLDAHDARLAALEGQANQGDGGSGAAASDD